MDTRDFTVRRVRDVHGVRSVEMQSDVQEAQLATVTVEPTLAYGATQPAIADASATRLTADQPGMSA